MKRILIGVIFVLIFLLISRAVTLNAQAAELELRFRIDNRKSIIDERVKDNVSRTVGYRTRQSMMLEEEQIAMKLDRKAEAERERLAAKIEAKRVAEEKKLAEERRVANEKKAAQPKTTAKQSTQNISGNQNFHLSFYSTLPEENGGYSNMANGQSIHGASMVVASNYYPIGTKIYLEGWGTMTVSDRGGSDFNSSSRLDVLIQRNSGESTSSYKARIRALGRRTVSGKILD